MTSSDDEEFDELIGAAYAEPLMITAAISDDDMIDVAPTPPRPGVDRGIAGSLIQARDRLRAQRREQMDPPWRDRVSITAAAVMIGSGTVLGVLIGGGAALGVATVLAAGALVALAAAALVVLWWRHGPSAGERTLNSAIAAEQHAGRALAAALAGSSWVLLHDRRLPHSEHRVPFLAVGPAGIVVIALLPAGPYLILTPGGVRAGDDELASGWIPARVWEARFLMRQLADAATRDLRFTGPVLPVAVDVYPPSTKLPEGWSAQPPYCIGDYPIRRPAALAQFLQYLPARFAPHHVVQLAQLVDQRCEPAPRPDWAPPGAANRIGD